MAAVRLIRSILEPAGVAGSGPEEAGVAWRQPGGGWAAAGGGQSGAGRGSEGRPGGRNDQGGSQRGKSIFLRTRDHNYFGTWSRSTGNDRMDCSMYPAFHTRWGP